MAVKSEISQKPRESRLRAKGSGLLVHAFSLLLLHDEAKLRRVGHNRNVANAILELVHFERVWHNFIQYMMSSSGQTPAEEEESVEMEENGHEKSTPTYCLFVGDLSLFCNESDLQVAFSPFGEISEVRMKRNKVTKRHLSYGFVEYTQPNAAVAAMNEMNGKLLNGRALK